MRHPSALALVIALTTLALPAQAAEIDLSATSPTPEFTWGHAAGAYVSGVAGTGIAGTAGVALGALVPVGLGCQQGLDCAFASIAGGTFGYLLISPLGTAAGVTIYGEANNLGGSFGVTLIGSYIGTGVGLGLAALLVAAIDDEQGKLAGAVTPALLVPAVGATLAYYLSSEPNTPRKRQRVPSGGLVDYSPEDGFELAPPNGSLLPDGEGGLNAHLTLVGGTF